MRELLNSSLHTLAFVYLPLSLSVLPCGRIQCRLRTSAQAEFTGQVMGLIQGQIVSAVAKVTKDDHKTLLGLIEEALSGKGAGEGAGSTANRRAKKVMTNSFVTAPRPLFFLTCILLRAYLT